MAPRNLLASIALLCACASDLPAQVTIEVFPTLAPNVFGSPSFASWYDNVFTALRTGATDAGDPGTPTHFALAPAQILAGDVVVTAFPSWRGLADPGVTVGSAFAHELGTRLQFTTLIDGHGTAFSISQLSFTLTATGDAFDYSFSNPAGVYQYGPYWRGISFGADRAPGGGDDTVVTSGGGTQLVDIIIGRGSGLAWAPEAGATGTDQQRIDAVVADITSAVPIVVTGTYSLAGFATGSAAATIIPEPATYGLVFGCAVFGLALWRRFRRRQ